MRKDLRVHLLMPHHYGIFPIISLKADDDSAFALETPAMEACYILKQCDPSHCVVYLEIYDQGRKVWSYKHFEV